MAEPVQSSPDLRQVDDDVEFVAWNPDRSVPAGFERFRRADERSGGQDDDAIKYAHRTISAVRRNAG